VYVLLRYHAFLFVTHVEGWKRFCAEGPMKPERCSITCPADHH
jgi:hypothetical protein